MNALFLQPFDVKSITSIKDGIKVEGLYDVQEQQLNQKMSNAFQKDPASKAASSYAQFLLNYYAVLNSNTIVNIASPTLTHIDQFRITQNIAPTNIASPPPKLLLV